MTLPTPQVQALAECYTDLHPVTRLRPTCLYSRADERVRAEHVQALALEVLASRERRCENCYWWRHTKDQMGRCGYVADGRLWPFLDTPSRFFCADFTPKEPK